MKKKNKQKRRAQQKQARVSMRNHRWSMFAICLVLILLIGMVTVSSITLKAKEESYRAQEIELEQQIEDEKARAEEIEDLEDYVGTDEYVEEIAKEKLGLVYDDEIVFRAQ